MPEQPVQEAQPIQLPPLDPGRLLERIKEYNPDLYFRVIAEEQRQQLAEMVQQLSQQQPQTNDPEIAEETEHELDLASKKDEAA